MTRGHHCTGKAWFITAAHAERSAKRLRRLGLKNRTASQRGGHLERMQAYKCPSCEFYHLGHVKKGRGAKPLETQEVLHGT